MLAQFSRYLLATSIIEERIEYETIVISVIISSKPSKAPRAYCQNTYFYLEKKRTNLLTMDLFPEESQEQEI